MLYEERLEAAERRRMEGNELYAAEQYEECLSKYVLGLNYFSEEFMMQVQRWGEFFCVRSMLSCVCYYCICIVVTWVLLHVYAWS